MAFVREEWQAVVRREGQFLQCADVMCVGVNRVALVEYDRVLCGLRKMQFFGGLVAGEIIRLGDRTSHDGTVVEGSQFDICMGKPIAYLGHKVYCPKCKGNFPIVEGVMTTSFFGKGVALAGMKTSCGAVLIASQFTDTVEYGGGVRGSGSSGKIERPPGPSAEVRQGANVTSTVEAVSNLGRTDNARQIFDEQIQVAKLAIGLPYLIVTRDGRRAAGRVDRDGLLPRVATESAEEFEIYWGDEALARQEAS